MHDIVIVGGGIGGMAAAIALRQRDLSAAVYEVAPELRAVGAGIAVPPNAMQVFGRLGLAATVQQARSQRMKCTGSRLWTLPRVPGAAARV